MCRALWLIFKAVFHLIWGTLKALASPFRRKGTLVDYGDEICLITGAAQGLGKHFALEFARRNAVLVLWDIQEDKLKATADEIREEFGSKVYTYVCDCSSREDINRAAAKVKKTVGNVSVLVNNAGVLMVRTVMEAEDEDIEQTFKVNTLASFWTVKAFLPWMLDNNYGYIVQISSVLASSGAPKVSDYAASKAALKAFTESLYYELRGQRKTGITVTCVCPSWMDTDLVAGTNPNIPAASVESTVERTLYAMKEGQFLVTVPAIWHLPPFVKSFLPTRTMDCLMDLAGAYNAMDAIERKKKSS